MSSETWGMVIGLFICVALVVGSVGHCAKVTSDCNRKDGVVVRNYANLPTCIEQGEHP